MLWIFFFFWRNGYVSLSDKVVDFVKLLLSKYSFAQEPLKLDDPERMTLDVIKEIYSFYSLSNNLIVSPSYIDSPLLGD